MYHKVSNRYFFRSENVDELSIQIPSNADIKHMQFLPAGGDEDQSQRLGNMVQRIAQIKEHYPALPLRPTDEISLSKGWQKVLQEIGQGDEEAAFNALKKIPNTDPIMQAILTAHSFTYIKKLVSYAINSHHSGALKVNPDVIITPGSFGVLIKDIATTLAYSAKVHISFGLPSHHAFHGEGSGFCILNKTAILLNHMAQVKQAAQKFVIIGTDVNRDNGLCHELLNYSSHLPICHLDVFDSRVYPHQDQNDIAKEFTTASQELEQHIYYWQQQQYTYFAIDLSLTLREGKQFHPALAFTLRQLETELAQAKSKGQKVMLFLPTGWDSHVEETAYCGKYVNRRLLKKAEAQVVRFSNEDLTYFYEHLFSLYQQNKEWMTGIYWGLEGGYYRPMYEQQLDLFLQILMDKLMPQESNSKLMSN